MSHQLQINAELKTGQEQLSQGLEQLSERVEAIEATNAQVADVISRALEATQTKLIEGFTLKFIQSLDGPTNYIKRSVEGNGQQLERAEQQTADLEEKIRTCQAGMSGLLDEATGKLAETFESQHARNEASIKQFSDKTAAINVAAMKIAEVNRICEKFKQDYEQTATLAKISMKHASNTLDDLVVQLHGEAENQRAQNLKAQRTRYILFIVIAFMAGALFTLLIVLLALLLK